MAGRRACASVLVRLAPLFRGFSGIARGHVCWWCIPGSITRVSLPLYPQYSHVTACMCTCVWLYVCTCIYMHVFAGDVPQVLTRDCMYAFVYMCVYVYAYVCLNLHRACFDALFVPSTVILCCVCVHVCVYVFT